MQIKHFTPNLDNHQFWLDKLEDKGINFLKKYGTIENFLTEEDKDNMDYDEEAMKDNAEEMLAQSLPKVELPHDNVEIEDDYGWAILWVDLNDEITDDDGDTYHPHKISYLELPE